MIDHHSIGVNPANVIHQDDQITLLLSVGRTSHAFCVNFNSTRHRRNENANPLAGHGHLGFGCTSEKAACPRCQSNPTCLMWGTLGSVVRAADGSHARTNFVRRSEEALCMGRRLSGQAGRTCVANKYAIKRAPLIFAMASAGNDRLRFKARTWKRVLRV